MSDEREDLTWSELDRRANSLAAALVQAGVNRRDVIALRMTTRIEWVVTQAALGKLGAIAVGVNWRATPSELEFILTNSGAVGIVCDDRDPAALLPTLSAVGLKVMVSVETLSAGTLSYREMTSSSTAPGLCSAEDTPLIIYTSGTTGAPKGVLLGRPPGAPPPTPADLKYAASVGNAIPKSPDDVVLVNMPISHGSAPAQIRAAIHSGARTVLRGKFEPEGVVQTISGEGVTAWVAVPTMLNRLSTISPEALHSCDLSSLRSIQVGGAPVSSSTRTWVVEHFGPILHEGYGCTEAGMLTHLTPEDLARKSGSCGRPYACVDIDIRNEDGKPLPIGDTGEIWVRTPVVRNYYNAPPHGPDTVDSLGFYRTGDVGRLDAEGFLFITDRIKDMIVSGGVNVYPAEIERVLHEHPAVHDAAVIGVPDPDFGEVGKAFVELKPGQAATPEEILQFCKPKVAGYKLPKTLELISELPRNPMGKVLKRQLRAPFWKDRERSV